jgi:hypothetical protein
MTTISIITMACHWPLRGITSPPKKLFSLFTMKSNRIIAVAITMIMRVKFSNSSLISVLIRYKAEYVYVSWLARCYIMNGNPRSAWELYLKLNNSRHEEYIYRCTPTSLCLTFSYLLCFF